MNLSLSWWPPVIMYGMFKPFEVFIGLRYVRARRRNHFISFISMTSILGLALGVAALITVLSVMNGFDKELKSRILGMASDADVIDYGGTLSHWRELAAKIEQHPDITGVAPYLQAEGMAVNGKQVQGTVVNGILPKQEPKVSVIKQKMISGNFDALTAGSFNAIIGTEMAQALGVQVGDKITLVAPQANVTPAGILPRLKRFTVVGIFDVGLHEFDSALVLINLKDAEVFFRAAGPTGLRLKTSNIMEAPRISREVMRRIPGTYEVIDWTQQRPNFFKALKTEKMTMFVILSLIVAVAAFNIISTLVMTVTDKEADIAVLRTLGASPRSILAIFMLQGTVIGLIGLLFGDVCGVWLALHVETLVPAIERLFHVHFLSPQVYYISELPSDLHWHDVIVISMVAFIFSITASIYPARRASRTKPAEALRYE